MGSQNDKDKKETDLNELNDLAKVSNPIMPTTGGRACVIEDGKIILNFRHYKKEFDSLNLNLEKIKNKMNLIISEEMIEIMQIKFQKYKDISKSQDISSSIDSFTSTYKTELGNYFNSLNEIKKIYKETSLSISSFLTNWLKVQKRTETDGEVVKVEESEKKLDNFINNVNKFTNSEETLNKICYFKINYSKDKINDINNYFEEKKDEINVNYNFENAAQFRSLINTKEQLIDSIREKNNFVEILDKYYKDYISLYKKVLLQINSTNNEKVEIANEFNDYNGVVIYHRLIRSIEERIKKIKI